MQKFWRLPPQEPAQAKEHFPLQRKHQQIEGCRELQKYLNTVLVKAFTRSNNMYHMFIMYIFISYITIEDY